MGRNRIIRRIVNALKMISRGFRIVNSIYSELKEEYNHNNELFETE